MMIIGFRIPMIVIMAFTMSLRSAGQVASESAAGSATPRLIVGHPFTAIKFAHRVKALPSGKRQFLRNERYPTRIARDSAGRLMMQVPRKDGLPPECDHLELLQPPPCPAWTVVVVDPVAHRLTHWSEGEIANHSAVEFPLTAARLEEVEAATSLLPALGPDFSDEDGNVETKDLGVRDIDGLQASGVRWTLHFTVDQDGQKIQRTRIHEVWTSAEMALIVRVIDGDPDGEETVWGLEKISLAPDASLFRPPDGYELERRTSAQWLPMLDNFTRADFAALHDWFGK